MNALDMAIASVGGVCKLAAALGVSQPVISNWRARGTRPDALRCVAIERATLGVVTRRDLRPDDWQDIWPELSESETNSTPAPAHQAPAAINQEAKGVPHG